ncbi:MAG: malate synthase [Acidobacteria bacterium]|nr:malate synthase [Acidobacteriota bacterium]
MIGGNVFHLFPELFRTKTINGRQVNVEETLESLTREIEPEIIQALRARKALLQSAAPVDKKYAWPNWDDAFSDPVTGQNWTFRQIVQGLIDNFFSRESRWRWRLNDEVAVPEDAHPLKNPGLELTGPWHPLDMAINALNSPAPMNMPDFEDASPPHFQPAGVPATQPIGTFAALRNAQQIFEGHWNNRSYEAVKKEKKRLYRIHKLPREWPTRFVRPPSLHVRYDQITVDDKPAPGLIVMVTLWVINNYEALKRAGTGVYFYIPKMQTPQEAFIVEKLLSRIETIIGVQCGTLKIKMLYEEGNAGRFLPAIIWTLRRRLLGTNVGRWDYLASLIEMWKDDPKGVFPDPQTIGMASPNMIAYQRYNALMMLLAGTKDGRLTQAAPIGGMAAVMIYQANDAYGRSRFNPQALRAITIDKLRERLLGLMFIPDQQVGQLRPTLDEILSGRILGQLYDSYRQSWVASPEPGYVDAGNRPLQIPLQELQALVSAPKKTLDVRGKQIASVNSGLLEPEQVLFAACGLLNEDGKITPRVVTADAIAAPEKLFSRKLWNEIYAVPKGEITIEHIQHAFYMAANYGFQILNGNFAAAIDDYELKQRFMNDLATYRINVSWLWTLLKHQAIVTKNGYLKRPALTDDGVELAVNALAVDAGARFTKELFEKVWEYHNEWTSELFAELDRRGDPGRFDRSKAPVIMDLLKRQLGSQQYIQHSARVLFIIGQADQSEREQILDVIFDLSRNEVLRRVETGTIDRRMLYIFDYVHDTFPAAEGKQMLPNEADPLG